MKVLVELILGHRASVRDKPTVEGYNYDWEVYVKGDQGNNISAFVDRVIFTLHESFPKPRRVLKEPPYSVKESGYAGFIINVEILFKNNGEPKKAEFKYDLFLQSQGSLSPISPSRKEKLIFNYPSEEFTRKLLKGGGKILEKSGSSGDKSLVSTSSTAPHHHSGGGKSKSKPATAGKAKEPPKNSFEDLFGPPIKRQCQSNNSVSSAITVSIPSSNSSTSSSSVSSSSASASSSSSSVSGKSSSSSSKNKENYCGSNLGGGDGGSVTPKMKLLQELHARIAIIIDDDPNKLQQIVDIVEFSGKDNFSMESGITFDFDLCKLSSSTIRKLKEVVMS